MKYILDSVIMVLAIVTVAAAGDIYNWRDENGVQHFSNSPVTSSGDSKSPVQVGKETNYVAPEKPHSERESVQNKRSRHERQSLTSGEEDVQASSHRKTHRKPSRPKSVNYPYDISWSRPSTDGANTIVLTGRVSGGNFCKKLLISVRLIDEYGRKTHIYCEASDVGGSGSRIASGSTRIKYRGHYSQDWKIIKQSTKCMIK